MQHPQRSWRLASRSWQLLRVRCTLCRAANVRPHPRVPHPGHVAATEVAADDSVTVELWTSALGGLTENDFIVAAKLDALSLSDLVVSAKKRTYFF